ncbi:MAG: iron-containing alcohol dehydrogenase [Pseudolabrys sp.]
MDYYPGTRVVFAVGAIVRLGELARDLGGKRILLVTDPGLWAAGHPQRALASLREAGLEVFVFDGVEENPTTRNVAAALDFARANRIDLITAVGGGSSMDCAKGVNFLLTNGGEMSDYMGFGKATKPMLPSIGVPTTSGTGSEGQSFALIANEKTHLKMACGDRKAAFRVAILDPEVTVSQPPKVTAITGIDAVSHALESYVTSRRNPLSQMFAREAWRLLDGNFETVLREPDNLEARGAMQIGAHFAGVAIETSMLGACHACANPLTAHYGLTHGVAIGVLLPHVIRFNAAAVGGLYGDLAHEVGLLNGDHGAAGEVLARRVTDLLRAAEMPTRLSECGVSRGIFSVLAEEASEQWTGRFNPRPVDETDLQRLYESAF